jgi:hypothetical protein
MSENKPQLDDDPNWLIGRKISPILIIFSYFDTFNKAFYTLRGFNKVWKERSLRLLEHFSSRDTDQYLKLTVRNDLERF